MPTRVKNSCPNRGARPGSLLMLLAAVLFPASASAQRLAGKWEVEVHGGAMPAQSPGGGVAALPDPGVPFVTANARTSRRESSWYFGDGAVLLNQVSAAIGISPRITPLDPALQSSVARTNSGLFGGRVSRRINPRISAEFSFDYSFSQLTMSDAVVSDVETTRASFVSAWTAVIGTGPFASPVITATTAMQSRAGRQLITVGALDVNLTRPHKFTPFAILGAGLLSHIGDTPSVTLTGKYQFLVDGVIAVMESDTVVVRYSSPGRALAGVFGGGFKYVKSARARAGVRVDVRVHLNHLAISTLVDATPSVSTATPGGTSSATTPSLQFASNPSPIPSSPSTLSGPPLAGFESFAGSGIERRISVTAGWFWRF